MRQPPRPPGPPAKPAGPATPPSPEPRASRAGRPSVINAAEEKPITLNISLGDEPSSELEKAEALRDVMQHAVTMSEAMALAKEMKSWPLRPILLAVVAVASLSVSAYTFIAEADWAFGPDPAQVSPIRRDAYVKFAMYLSAQQVESYRIANGTLPGTLEEVGAAWPSMTYERADTAFALRAPGAAGDPIVLRSTDDLKAFLSDSRRQLRENRP